MKPERSATTVALTFPPAARVRAKADYTRVFDNARRTADPLLVLHRVPGEQPARLGLAVSRKVSPRAVVRNRIKRVLREQFRRLRPLLRGGDCVVVARSAAATATGDQLRAALTGVLRRSGALPAQPDTMAASAENPVLSSHSKPDSRSG